MTDPSSPPSSPAATLPALTPAADPAPTRAKLTVPAIIARKGGPALTMVTAYDFFFARFAAAAGVDLLLVGDSLGMAFQGEESTVPVRLEHIVYHTRAVRRGAPQTHIVADLPFLTYQASDEQALASAGRLLQDGGADAVKLEGGRRYASRVQALVDAGIAVVGHVGLLPQTVGRLGGFRVQGRDEATARAILADAEAVVAAGAHALVIEAVPAPLATMITERVAVPTIGIGAGAGCDGQVLVSVDLLGIEDRFHPRFARQFASLGPQAEAAYAAFVRAVQAGEFPGPEHAYPMPPDVAAALAAERDG